MASASPSLALDPDEREGMPMTQFTSVQDLFEVVKQVQGDFLIVKNVSSTDFATLYLREKRPFSLPTFTKHFTMGSGRGIATNFTTFRPQGYPGSDGGEGDSSGGPIAVHGPKGSWPTLVIESGDSETLSALHDDMRWWFSASDHEVKIVLIAKFDHQNQTIIIERWEEESQNHQGATNTRQVTGGNTPRPVLRQSIIITEDTTTNPESYHVTSSGLVLSFRLLFLRDPGPQEGDFIISIPELEVYASMVFLNV
ncbi:uncharacterized protein F4812DRAFT_463446 [Daldinia caldariorum]|uniref:uncharacterized protein n=1 Tax=Daldinia caldariorum TaxID=326644 RepID=UPI002008E37C|nr:uncharacterized protein F4812DRAFT_463446 [Daldinia caldariorum]KAI1463619.1 hypothetical protein F4812DRAFT_463446 [Daldinia caldariorum]